MHLGERGALVVLSNAFPPGGNLGSPQGETLVDKFTKVSPGFAPGGDAWNTDNQVSPQGENQGGILESGKG